jgi:hypothetical protein
MINVKYRVEKVIPTQVRRSLYDGFRNVVTSSSKSNVTGHLHSDIFEQVRSQIMDPLEENLIILYPEKNYYDDTEEE